MLSPTTGREKRSDDELGFLISSRTGSRDVAVAGWVVVDYYIYISSRTGCRDVVVAGWVVVDYYYIYILLSPYFFPHS